MEWFHRITAWGLLFFHFLFLFRGFYLLKSGKGPEKVDKAARFWAQLLIPLVVTSGVMLLENPDRKMALHLIPCFLLIFSMPLNFLIRRIILKGNKRLPWLLPLLNGILILAGVITGIRL